MATVHNLTVNEVLRSENTFYAAVIKVTQPSELAPALAQRDRQVVIDNRLIDLLIGSVEFWKTVRFIGIGAIVATAIIWGMNLGYKIETPDWHMKWGIARIDGHFTLTPPKGD